MMKWDETIKNKLKGYESSLPEGSLDEFMARLESSGRPSGKKRLAPVVWISIPAFAAALTAFLLVGRHGPEMETVVESQQYISENGSAAGHETSMERTAPLPLPTGPVKTPVLVAQTVEEPEPRPEITDMPVMVVDADTASYAGYAGPISTDRSSKPVVPQVLDSSPFLDDEVGRKTPELKFKAFPTMAGALGCGLIAAILPVATGISDSQTVETIYVKTDAFNYKAHVSRSSENYSESHFRPIRAGLSLRAPFNDRFSIVTGVDYSWYFSTINKKSQNVQYLGVPARLDWTIVPNRRFGIYIGAGAMTEFCTAACQKGESIEKDGITFSLLAAGGVQYNITKSVSLFLEPTMSWRIPLSNTVLRTYRSSHPLMFSLSTGLRFTLSRK